VREVAKQAIMGCSCECLSKLSPSANGVVFSFNWFSKFTNDNVLEPVLGKRHILMPQNLLASLL